MGRRSSETCRPNEHCFAAIERHQNIWSAIYDYRAFMQCSREAKIQRSLRIRYLRIQEFFLQREREDPRQLFNRIGAISLDVDEREAATSSSDILDKKPLATETVQISTNNLSVAALRTENRVNVLDSVSFDIATASLNIVISPVGCGKST
ncbi:hypothetical protein sscle_05g041450 [Sclerotinia sclerotiorum 1980 UF-70]|uniref:Uncharacterized protein n=1 Tax=Sclerotinia sclerotiorum (strain ATCC 18683 / 1980 / Ss-1) TaxID=665079 RepID=A0A1D9Q352_SCLS1|nr:hypothetical protein sscle_05g041450 [Sclerotinia sclerotiorum 1980 UF-70]